MSYTNAPLSEVACELHFAPRETWDPTLPSIFFEHVKGIFPIKGQEVRSNFSVSISAQGLQSSPQEVVHFLKCSTEDGRSQVLVSQTSLLINGMPPYAGWDTWIKHIELCMEGFLKMYGNEEMAVVRAMLRYANKCEAHEHTYQNICEMFHIRPQVPDHMQPLPSAMQMVVESKRREEQDTFAVQLATLRPDGNLQAPVLFELTYLCEQADSLSAIGLTSWLDEAHSTIKQGFEQGITDSYRKRLQA